MSHHMYWSSNYEYGYSGALLEIPKQITGEKYKQMLKEQTFYLESKHKTKQNNLKNKNNQKPNVRFGGWVKLI